MAKIRRPLHIVRHRYSKCHSLDQDTFYLRSFLEQHNKVIHTQFSINQLEVRIDCLSRSQQFLKSCQSRAISFQVSDHDDRFQSYGCTRFQRLIISKYARQLSRAIAAVRLYSQKVLHSHSTPWSDKAQFQFQLSTKFKELGLIIYTFQLTS